MKTKLPAKAKIEHVKENGPSSVAQQRIQYPCGCEAIGPAPMPIDCPTHGASVAFLPTAAKQTVRVSVILDESGSMESCRQKTIDGINEYFRSLKSDDGAVYIVDLIKFDTGKPVCREVYSGINVRDAQDLTWDTYTPRGGTPMYDAIGQSVSKINDKSADKFIVVILTDGEENSSVEHTKDSIKKLIAQKTALGNWTFLYLGANQDAWAEARAMGIPTGNSMNYATPNMGSMMRSMGGMTTTYAVSNISATADFMGGVQYYVPSADDLSQAASTLGSVGGKKRASSLTSKRLKDIASTASKARWKKA